MSGKISDVSEAIEHPVKITEVSSMNDIKDGDKVKFVKCTKSQYDALEEKDPSTVYFVVDSEEVQNNEHGD